MAYRYGERNQITLFPESIESYISPDDPVRAYDTFINALDFKKLKIKLDMYKVGNSAYDPRAMLKLLVYGYSYGWRSSRKLERAVHHNISFIWLIGGLKPDHKTIAEFRRKNKKAIRKVFKQCVRLCIKLDLIEGNTFFVDGTKIRANASRNRNYTKEKYEKILSKVDNRIDEILNECEHIDDQESQQPSYVKMKKEFTNKKHLHNKIKDILAEFEEQGHKTKDGKERTKNLTDSDSTIMRSAQGSHVSYNVQSVVDDKHSLIANIDAVSDTSDLNQFSQQITQAEEVIEKQCDVACGDAGYANTDELEKIDKRGTKVIVPTQKQASDSEDTKFSKSTFQYDKEKNCYYCPEGHILVYKGKNDNGKKFVYKMKNAKVCRQCKHYGTCTKAERGRTITRLVNEEVKEKLEQQYEESESQEIYALRKARVEHPFGHIKHNLGMRNFLLRGNEGAQAEISTVATCFNIVRMITILGGVQAFIAAVQG